MFRVSEVVQIEPKIYEVVLDEKQFARASVGALSLNFLNKSTAKKCVRGDLLLLFEKNADNLLEVRILSKAPLKYLIQDFKDTQERLTDPKEGER